MKKTKLTIFEEISQECDEIRDLLVRKNELYGNSVFDPVRVFSQAAPDEQIKVRLDDKLSRYIKGEIKTDKELDKLLKDIAGYIILWRMFLRRKDV